MPSVPDSEVPRFVDDDEEVRSEGTRPDLTQRHVLRRPETSPGVTRVRWVEDGEEQTAEIRGRCLVGSAQGGGIVLRDRTVSRLHAELSLRDGALWVRDLGSRNGTRVGGLDVVEARVPDGARIELGSSVLVAQAAQRPEAPDLWPHERFGQLVGKSRAMRTLFASLARVASSRASALIHGETGTGKELIARALHEASPRAAGPFVVVDCGALPETLLDGELFGHARGAFTGAVAARAGALESASGGTVFLDEIGELPLAMQPKLLRALESRTVRRLGETTHRAVDVRFVCATHRDLPRMVAEGLFREDLYFRLAVLPVVVPPLRARPEDIPALVEHFLAVAQATERFDAAFVAELAERPWPGNVRELRNFVDRVLALGQERALALLGLAPAAQEAPVSSRVADEPSPPPAPVAPRVAVAAAVPAGAESGAELPAPAEPTDVGDPRLFDKPYRDFREAWTDVGEREYVRRLLERHGRNVQAAAKEAGVDRTYIYRLARRHGL